MSRAFRSRLVQFGGTGNAAGMAQTVFLTGASSGIGRATAELLSARGFQVWATARSSNRVPTLPGLHALALDLEDPDSIEAAWNRALAEAGRIDIVVQNAGAGIFGAVEDVSAEESARQWRILMEGPLHLLRLAAAHLRPRRAGVIVGVSSLAAELPLPFGAHYSAGKAAFSALLAGLEMELRPFGVRVVDLRPGDFRTAFNDNVTPAAPAGSEYGRWMMAAWRQSCALMTAAPGPEQAARAILAVIERPRPLLRCGTFFQAQLGALGVRLLPRRALLDSIRRYYHLDRIDSEAGPTR
jgi:NAD(P)-dependent dehydrogenase (short-subunit alcohol dehydrogenase family)